VKRFSSGMYVRLAFSVAAHLECDTLIVDEVLAVGDDAFQKKCLGKMSEVVGQGRTVLFVSHNMAAVAALTSRSIVMERGHVVFDGATDRAIERYLGHAGAVRQTFTAAPRPKDPTITLVTIQTSQGSGVQHYGEPLEVTFEITAPAAVAGARVDLALFNSLDRNCAYAWAYDAESPICREAGTHRFTCRFPKLRLAPGQYTVRVSLYDRDPYIRDLVERSCPFEVMVPGPLRDGGWPINDMAYIEDAEWSVTANAAAARLPSHAALR
jgi:lipopolysaccharide transport system ATP-binding protein